MTIQNRLTKFTKEVLKRNPQDIKVGFIIKTNGTCEIIDNSATMELEDMQKLVGGYIELVGYVDDENFECVVNEEGIILELPYNLNAYLITAFHLYGDVLVLRKGVMK